MAAGTIYQGVLNTGTDVVAWTPNPSAPARIYNSPSADSMANALAYCNGAFWGGFFNDKTILGLYTAGPTPTAWTAVNDSHVAGKQVTLLQVAGPTTPTPNQHLFMVGATWPGGNVTGSAASFELDFSATGASSWSTLVYGLSRPIVGVVYSPATAKYYMASGTTVYSDAGAPPTAFAATEPLPALAAGDQINALYADTANSRIFVLTKLGGIYFKDDGAGSGWAQVAAPVLSSVTVSLL